MSEKELPSFAEVEDPQGQTSHLEKANTTTSTSIDQDDEKFKFTFGKFIALYVRFSLTRPGNDHHMNLSD
jgi:hypothetical protein